MNIEYTSHNFPAHYGSDFTGTNNLTFSIQELMWSALTVGRANFMDVISNGVYSEYEILYRTSILIANLSIDKGSLVKSSAYEHLDPSEKSAVSYFLGLSFTKLISQKRLNIPWLLHIDVYRSQFITSGQAFKFGSSRSRPDLIGLDTKRNWTIFESKGRTNGMEKSLLASAKKQTRNLRKIGNAFPALRVAVVTHFIKGKLTIDWADPEGNNDEHFDIETSVQDFLANYYRVIFNVLSANEGRNVEMNEFVTFTFDAIDLTIGLEKQIYEAYKSQNLELIQPKKFDNFQEFRNFKNQDFFVGNDGVLIGLGNNWSELIRTNEK